MPSQTNTKTLYTPVFFSSSEPRGSTTSANPKVPSAYLNSLSRTHIALAQIVQEEPPSRPGSPTDDADGSYPDLSTQQRVSALRARVQEAWTMTDGNPADGKWTVLTHLLRIGVTSGKAGRWAGTRADLKVPDVPDGGWINATTEAEWVEWEKRVGLKDKVQNWKMRLESHEQLDSQIIKDTPNASKSDHQEEAKTADTKEVTTALTTAKAADSTPILAAQPNLSVTSESAAARSDPLKNKSLFGFAVVKRSNPSAAAVGKKPHVDPKPVNQANNAPAAPPPDRKIVDIPEMSFLPPSFPSSQIITSTPTAKPVSSDKHKPEPIPFTASPIDNPVSPPLASQHVTKVYGQQSSSLPAIPSYLPLPPVPTTPTRNRDDTLNDNNKRPFYSPDRAVKKARTMPSLDSPPAAAEFGIPQHVFLPTTPKRQNLPTLTELLASAKKGKKAQSPKGLKPKSAEVDFSTNPTSNFRFPSPLPAFEDNPYMLDPYAIRVNHSELEPDISPTKSLSSLAGSDSEDEAGDGEFKYPAIGLGFSPSSFKPYAASTQHQNYPSVGNNGHVMSPHSSPLLGEDGKYGAALSLGFGGYNSQFDVAGQVDAVDKLLEKDVDYEGWLRDPSLEREVDESP